MTPRRDHVALSVVDGRTLRDLFHNGLLDQLGKAGYRVTVFTEAATVPSLRGEWERPGVRFAPLLPADAGARRNRAYRVRRRVAKLRSQALLRAWLAAEHRFLYPARPEYIRAFREDPPDVVVATHAHLFEETELLAAARTLGIPTLGLVRSWDNVHKGIRGRPDRLAVWNEVNRREVVDLEGYPEDRVHIVGPAQFDAYFEPGARWSREDLCARFRLDPERPILLYASLGYFLPTLDETCWLESLLRRIDAGEVKGEPQVLCRLHPWSRLEHFQRFASHPDLRLSYVDRYIPSLTWTMTRDDVVEVANMLHHADAVVTPGSTMVLEAAIFDTPTVVPTFHTYQPERGEAYFREWVLGKHYRRIQELDLVPFAHTEEAYVEALNRSLDDPAWYREQRARLVRDYVPFTDGRSTQRFADLIASVAQGGRA